MARYYDWGLWVRTCLLRIVYRLELIRNVPFGRNLSCVQKPAEGSGKSGVQEDSGDTVARTLPEGKRARIVFAVSKPESGCHKRVQSRMCFDRLQRWGIFIFLWVRPFYLSFRHPFFLSHFLGLSVSGFYHYPSLRPNKSVYLSIYLSVTFLLVYGSLPRRNFAPPFAPCSAPTPAAHSSLRFFRNVYASRATARATSSHKVQPMLRGKKHNSTTLSGAFSPLGASHIPRALANVRLQVNGFLG